MKRFQACFLSTLAAFVIGFSINSFSPEAINRNEVLNLVRDFNKALIENDQNFLSEVYDENVTTSK